MSIENKNRTQTATLDQQLTDSGHSASAVGDALLVNADRDQQPTPSIVMPTLNEEDGVGECIVQAKHVVAELGVPAEIISSSMPASTNNEL